MDKEVKIEVKTEADQTEVEALEDKINQLKREKIQLDINANTQKLQETEARIEQLKHERANLDVNADDSKIKQIETELAQLESDKIDLQLAVETGKLDQAEAEIAELDGSQIDVSVNNISAMESLSQIGDGIDRLKSGASEIGQQLGSVLEAAGKQETNKTFLEMSVGADQAAKSLETINSIVRDLPGDDTALQGLLSSASAKNASLTANELRNMGTAAADYFSAMSYYGKSATEAQQDMTNYILAGNTAELERSPILQGHIDELKNASTVQERSLALQKALNEEGWGGMSQQDTYNNKLETFNGMLERGKYNLGGMFQAGAMAGMDFLMTLDESTNGLVGIGIALAQMASPLTDALMGLGQIATGLKSLKEAGNLLNLGDKLNTLKTALFSVGTMAKTAALEMWNLGKKTILAGLNALRSAGMWAIEKAALIASELASKAAAAAQWLLNIAMDANPVMLVVLAIIALIAILGYLYFNNEQVRNAVNWLGQTFVEVGQIIYNTAIWVVNWVIAQLQALWNYIITVGGLLPQNVSITGNQIIDTVLRVLAFLATLPMQIGIILINTIAKVLGFGNNFVQNITNAASKAVSNFVNYISQLPGKLSAELNQMINDAINFASRLPQIIGDAAANALANWIGITGEHSPGFMYEAFSGELTAMENVAVESRKGLPDIMGDTGKGIVNNFNPELNTGYSNGRGSFGGDTIINVYGDVDSEARIRQIVEAVRRELSWNNVTCGRRV